MSSEPMEDECTVEITLISAQDLKPPSAAAALRRRSPSFYAVAWVDPAFKLRTLSDPLGGVSPTWNDRFLFRLPAAALHDSANAAAVSVDIYAAGHFCLPSSLVGSVRLLLSTLNLNGRPHRAPSFAAVGVRRPSGRFHGVLNVAATVNPKISALVARALSVSPAVAYRDLNDFCRRLPPPPLSVDTKQSRLLLRTEPLKEVNREFGDPQKVFLSEGGATVLCGLGVPKIHVSPSDQNLQISMEDENSPP